MSRDPVQGRIEGEFPQAVVDEIRDAKDPRTVRTEPLTQALRVDAREARKRAQEGKHRAR